jgi:hypothetical protein
LISYGFFAIVNGTLGGSKMVRSSIWTMMDLMMQRGEMLLLHSLPAL